MSTKSATRITVSTFGAIAGLAGIEHGIGEVLQGNTAPQSLVIQSWPDSEFFRVLDGEPAMTIIPNLLATGVLSILVSLVFLIWATIFVHRRHSGLVLVLLSVVMLLVGAGFGPPVLGTIVAIAAMRMNNPAPSQGTSPPTGMVRLLSDLWPWSLFAALMAWLLLMPGTNLIDYFFGIDNSELVIPVIGFSAFGLLLLALFSARVHDISQQTQAHHGRTVAG